LSIRPKDSGDVVAELRKSLELRAHWQLAQHTDWKYGGIPGLLLQFGRSFRRVPPPRIRGGWNRKRKECFRNAYLNMSKDPDRFVYCEGYLSIGGAEPPIEHAWIIDRASPDGAIDTTLAPGEHLYFGIPLMLSYMNRLNSAHCQWPCLWNVSLFKGELSVEAFTGLELFP